jgi:hypothetical protein
MKSPFLIFIALLPCAALRAQIPVTDIANLANNQIAHIATIAKWAESISTLRTQISQLSRQISIQDDLRRWSGNPLEASGNVILGTLGADDLVREYGRTHDAILGSVESLASLADTRSGNYRAIPSADLDGGEVQHDQLTFRRYAVLDATQENAVQVAEETKDREEELQEEIALTLTALKAAPTDAETQKLAAKLTALNGQLDQVEATRRREVDAVALQKIANDARLEQERIAAVELAAKDAYLANRRVTNYMKTLKLRNNESR